MENKRIIMLIIVIAVIAFGLGLLFNHLVFTGKVISDSNAGNYSWTTAICNSQNECIDVHVFCEDGKVVSMQPVSNLTRFGEKWEDPRLEVDKKFCE